MTRVYKYVFEDLMRPVTAPAGKVVRVDPNPADPGQIAFWMLVTDDDLAGPPVRYAIVATGETFDNALDHVGTAITPGGFVWHVVRVRIVAP